jgi:hypothetical protein
MPKLKEYLFGKKSKVKTQDLRTEEQKMLQALIEEGLTKGTGPFADIFGEFDENAFQEGVANPALKNFKENILPQIQEQFIAGNAVQGSGLQRAKVKGATDLQSKLAELMYGAQQKQNENRLSGLGLINNAQGKQSYVKEGSKGLVNSAVEGFAGAAGKGVGTGVANLFSGDSVPKPGPQTQVG